MYTVKMDNLIQNYNDRNKVNRPKLEVTDLIYIFCIGGLIGTVYEVVLTLITKGIIEDRSGSVFTPFNYVYGIGAVVMVLVLYQITDKSKLFFVGAILGGGIEYTLCLGQEVLLGTRSWDYSEKVLNIGGRTTLPYMLVWGGLCLLAITIIFPTMLRIIHRIPAKLKRKLVMVLAVIICMDAIFSILAVIRYVGRENGIYYNHWFFSMIDRIFCDTFMQTHFPNMIL